MERQECDGEKNLDCLLATIKPQLNPGQYVFGRAADISAVPLDKIIGLFREDEGITVIMKKEDADLLGLSYEYVAAWITLTVHSSLEAVGLMAAFAAALSREGLSCNVVAANFHDHIFVKFKDAPAAMNALERLSNTAKGAIAGQP